MMELEISDFYSLKIKKNGEKMSFLFDLNHIII